MPGTPQPADTLLGQTAGVHTHVRETTVVSSAWDGFPSLDTSVLLLVPRGSVDH